MGVSNFDISDRISIDGYGDPDWGNQVYLGFVGGSASLEQSLPTATGGTSSYNAWMQSFMGYAVITDRSVNQALDAASLDVLGSKFALSCLRNGFTPYWAGFAIPQPTSTLAVYGNGNVYLRNHESHTISRPSVSGPTSGPVGTSVSLTFSASGDSLGHNVRYVVD